MPRPAMALNEKSTEQERKTVGVYDRPASADRARNLKVCVMVIAAIASVASLYFFLGT